MRRPNHLILDFESSKLKSLQTHWTSTLLICTANSSTDNAESLRLKFNSKFMRSLPVSDLRTKTTVRTISNQCFLNFRSKKKRLLNRLLKQEPQSLFPHHNVYNPSWYWLLNLNFLVKERLYTKLKYSRSPAYDIVSGGAAAILAGFLGFLISEKFGFELVDSGDFYYLFIYISFLAFILRPLLLIVYFKDGLFSAISPKNIYSFYSQILLITLRIIK